MGSPAPAKLPQVGGFEPLEDKSLDVCLAKAVILLMLATGRSLEDVSACTTDELELRTDG